MIGYVNLTRTTETRKKIRDHIQTAGKLFHCSAIHCYLINFLLTNKYEQNHRIGA